MNWNVWTSQPVYVVIRSFSWTLIAYLNQFLLISDDHRLFLSVLQWMLCDAMMIIIERILIYKPKPSASDSTANVFKSHSHFESLIVNMTNWKGHFKHCRFRFFFFFFRKEPNNSYGCFWYPWFACYFEIFQFVSNVVGLGMEKNRWIAIE